MRAYSGKILRGGGHWVTASGQGRGARVADGGRRRIFPPGHHGDAWCRHSESFAISEANSHLEAGRELTPTKK